MGFTKLDGMCRTAGWLDMEECASARWPARVGLMVAEWVDSMPRGCQGPRERSSDGTQGVQGANVDEVRVESGQVEI